MRRVMIALLLLFILPISFVSGCGNTAPGRPEETGDEATVTVVDSFGRPSPFRKM